MSVGDSVRSLVLMRSLMLGACGVLAGCGGGPPAVPKPVLAPVTGSVQVGGKPAAGVAITLTPTGQTKGQSGWGTTDAEGRFEISSRSDKGAVEGEYIISFTQFVQPDGKPLPPNTSPVEANAVQGIASPWSDTASSSPKQKVVVGPMGASGLVFELPAPAKRRAAS